MRSHEGAPVAGAVAEDHVHLLRLGQPQPDAGREQVPERQHVLTRVLQRGDHVHADRPALGQQQAEGGLDPVADFRSVMYAVSAASSSTTRTSSGSSTVGDVLAGDPAQPGCPLAASRLTASSRTSAMLSGSS